MYWVHFYIICSKLHAPCNFFNTIIIESLVVQQLARKQDGMMQDYSHSILAYDYKMHFLYKL